MTSLASELALRAGLGAVAGAVVGSFLATVLLRWPRGRSALSGRSACDGCGRRLGVLELVPLLSWAALKGRCRTCGHGIAAEHPAIELAAALLGGVSLLAHEGINGWTTAAFGWWLLLLAALDARHQWLPDLLTLPLVPLGLLAAVAGIGPAPEARAIGALAGFAVLAGIGWLYQRVRGRIGLGGGDPKLLAGLGAWLGWTQLPFVLLGAGLLGLAAILLRRARGEQVQATDRLPLGTLMALAAWPLWLLAVTQTS